MMIDKNSSIKEILIQSLALIYKPNKWARKKFAGKKVRLLNGDGCEVIQSTNTLDKDASCFCAIGAILRTCQFGVEHFPYKKDDPSVRANFIENLPANIKLAIKKLHESIDDFHSMGTDSFEKSKDDYVLDVENFNDTSTHDMVKVLFMKAIYNS